MRKEKLEELKGYIEEFKTIKVEELENPGFLTIHKRLYTLQNGKQVTREILKERLDSVFAGSGVEVWSCEF